MAVEDFIKEAFEEVRKFHPEVSYVLFTDEGWLFANENLTYPSFQEDNLNIDILEDAYKAVAEYPASFKYESNN